MIDYLIISLIFFFLGRYTVSTQDLESAKKIIKNLKKTELGAVRRPSAEKLRLTGTKEGEEEQEMEKFLDKHL